MPHSLPLPSDTSDPLVWADWLELLALTAPDGNSSHGDLNQVLGMLGAENLDSISIDTMNEINRRVVACGASYPFSFSGALLSLKGDWRDYTPYVFCLLLSYCEDEKKKVKGVKHAVLFEQLSCVAAQHYLGGNVLRFGAPRTELPAGFAEALRVVSAAVKEWTPTSEKTLRRKDGGLDLVAWKQFPDQQIGKLILFGHCASGNDWDTKINELLPNEFCSAWLGGDKSPIVKTFFIPHRLPPDIFSFHAISAKLFFDRCRIAFSVPNDEFRRITNDASVDWCESLLEKVRN